MNIYITHIYTKLNLKIEIIEKILIKVVIKASTPLLYNMYILTYLNFVLFNMKKT